MAGNNNGKVEYWRSILGYEGFYEVSTFGRIRRFDHVVKGKIGKLEKSHKV